MIFLLLALSSSLQINRMFSADQVQHILQKRLPKRGFYIVGDLEGYNSMIKSVAIPKYAIASYESNRLHFFYVHDKKSICYCVWDGQVRFDEKKEIMENVLMWWKEATNSCFDRLINYEDGQIFTELIQDLECNIEDTDDL